MTRTRKILAIGAGTLVLLIIAALIAVPLVFEDRVADFLRAEANERLNAKVDLDEIDLSLLSTFPTLTAEVIGLHILGVGEFEGETLLAVRSFGIGLDLWALVFDDRIRIESVRIERPDIRVRVTEDGQANYDIVKETDEPQEETTMSLELRSIRIREGSLSYESPDLDATINGLEHRGSADIGASTGGR